MDVVVVIWCVDMVAGGARLRKRDTEETKTETDE